MGFTFEESEVLHGGRALAVFQVPGVSPGGETLGEASGVTFGGGYEAAPLRTLGRLAPLGHCYVSFSASGHATALVLLGKEKDLRARGIWPKFDANEARHVANAVNLPPFTLMLTDEVTSGNLRVLHKAKGTAASVSVQNGQLVYEDVDFVGTMITLPSEEAGDGNAAQSATVQV